MTETTIRLPNKRELLHEKHAAPDTACRLNDHGHELAKNGNSAAALVAFRRSVALAPENPLILSGLSAILFDSGNYAEGEAVVRKAIAIEQEYAPSWGNLGAVLNAQGK